MARYGGWRDGMARDEGSARLWTSKCSRGAWKKHNNYITSMRRNRSRNSEAYSEPELVASSIGGLSRTKPHGSVHA